MFLYYFPQIFREIGVQRNLRTCLIPTPTRRKRVTFINSEILFVLVKRVKMGWKNWSYWFKGGVIGIIFHIVNLLIGLLLVLIIPDYIPLRYFEYIVLWPGLVPGKFYGRQPCYGEDCLTATGLFGSFIIAMIGYFLIGIIIGWIYGKIKNK